MDDPVNGISKYQEDNSFFLRKSKVATKRASIKLINFFNDYDKGTLFLW